MQKKTSFISNKSPIASLAWVLVAASVAILFAGASVVAHNKPPCQTTAQPTHLTQTVVSFKLE